MKSATTIPKVKEEETSYQPVTFNSPSGPELSSCLEAYLHMMKTGEYDGTNAVKNSLRNEGWDSSELLPENWMSNGCAFISKEGFYFESPLKVLQFLQRFVGNSLAESDLAKVQNFLRSKFSWQTSETSKGKSSVTFSDGNKFPSKRLALQHLIKNNFPSDFIIRMR